MITLTVDYEVPPDRLVTIKLPEAVRPGRHELLIVLEENVAKKSGNDTNMKALVQFGWHSQSF